MADVRFRNLRFYLRQRPVMLVLLSALAVIFFLAVSGLSRVYHAQRESVGARWFNRGVADLNAQRFDAAVRDFRAALMYSRDDYHYQLMLAEALIGLKHTGEASAYLLNLWEREPEDGLVNLELARIAAQRGQNQQAVRHYHDAVAAAWPSDQEEKRRDARLELIELLLRLNGTAQAQAELIGFSANAREEPAEQQQLGDLFVRAGDYGHALADYQLSLKSKPHNAAALAGAGNAAFELGRYSLAEQYLKLAVEGDANDKRSADLLKTAEMVLRMDPFRRQINSAERNRIVVEAFTSAGQRLDCAVPKNAAGNTAQSATSLSDQWSSLRPQVTERNLQKNPDLAESAMELVFRVERQTSEVCGTPTGTDLALLLISQLHEGK